MLLAPVPWACRVWALPFLSAQAPYERYAAERGKRHKPLTGWAWQLLLLVRRWQPEREVVAVADDGYASLKLLYRCRRLKNPITFITRLRLYAALYEPAPPRKPRQKGRPRLKDERLPNLSVAAEDPATVWMPLAVSNWYGGRRRTAEVVSKTALWQQRGLARRALAVGADPTFSWLVKRWQMEATFQEIRQRLGFETQRHWSEGAIRTGAPALLWGSPRWLHSSPTVREGADVERRATGGMVRQASSDLLRCTGAGTQGVVGAGADFLRVASRDRHGQGLAGSSWSG